MKNPFNEEFIDQVLLEVLSPEEIEKEAKNGYLYAMERTAFNYYYGIEFEENFEIAYYWYLKSAEKGSTEGMFNAGIMNAKGYGTSRNFAKATVFMQKAVAFGDKQAEEYAREFKRLAIAEKRAKEGNAQGQADLANGLIEIAKYMRNPERENYYKESFLLAQKAALQGNVDAICILASAYENGYGVEKNAQGN